MPRTAARWPRRAGWWLPCRVSKGDQLLRRSSVCGKFLDGVNSLEVRSGGSDQTQRIGQTPILIVRSTSSPLNLCESSQQSGCAKRSALTQAQRSQGTPLSITYSHVVRLSMFSDWDTVQGLESPRWSGGGVQTRSCAIHATSCKPQPDQYGLFVPSTPSLMQVSASFAMACSSILHEEPYR